MSNNPSLNESQSCSASRRAWPMRVGLGVTLATAVSLVACGGSDDGVDAAAQLEQGKQIFRYDTFGDEAQWTDTLHLHQVIRAAVDPVTALSVGLKVDAEVLPDAVVKGIQDGGVDLKSPATTVALLKVNAVAGVKGTVETVNGADTLTRVGITCALCHLTVDNSFAPGIGKRLDGWPNRDLNPGAIIALSPTIDAATKRALNAWGAGMYDPRHNIDSLRKPMVFPPAYGLEGLRRITLTGDGDDVAYWNRYVAVMQMGGLGMMDDPRLNLKITHGTQDLVSDKLPALQAYQLSLAAPPPPAGSFDVAAVARGKLVFEGAGQYAACHSGAAFTDANIRLHPPSDSMAEPETPSYASRTATKMYRTSSLKGVWQPAPYFHDGSAPTLEAVVLTHNSRRLLGLSMQQVNDLTQYLKFL